MDFIHERETYIFPKKECDRCKNKDFTTVLCKDSNESLCVNCFYQNHIDFKNIGGILLNIKENIDQNNIYYCYLDEIPLFNNNEFMKKISFSYQLSFDYLRSVLSKSSIPSRKIKPTTELISCINIIFS